MFNPPFQTYANTMVTISTAADAQYGRYDIGGSAPGLSQISGTHVLEVRMVAELVLDPSDLAKIINNNNSFVKVSLVVDPGTKSTKLWVTCPSCGH